MTGSTDPLGSGTQGTAAVAEPTVAVAVLTYRRPDDLAALLPLLTDQVAPLGGRGHVLVVDNDPDAGARTLVGSGGWPGVRYVHEPAPGIAAARNRALDEAADHDLLIFIDDDERPRPGWLGALLATYRVDRPTAVVGPVLSEYAVPPDAWVQAGRFFDRRRLPTGTQVDVAATNNLLLDLGALRRLGVRFDDRFGLSGGSDTLFTRRITGSGHRIVWCDEAVVTDVVPASRLTPRWVLRRAYRSGNSWSRTSTELARSRVQRARVRASCSVRGCVRVAGGALQWVAGVLLRSLRHRARGARTVMRGAGMVSGAWGSVYAEYRRPA